VRSGYNEFLIEAAAHIKNEPFFKRQIYPKRLRDGNPEVFSISRQ
jgi:hypothetical protein